MKKIWIAFILVMLLIVGCGKTEELKEENQVQGTQVDASKDDSEESSEEENENLEENQEEVPEDSQEQTQEQTQEQEEEWDESKAVTMAVTTNVNFRTEPNTDCEVITVLKQWTEVKAYEAVDGWSKVKVDEKVGYVSAEFLIDPSDIPEEPEVPETSETPEQTTPSAPKVEAIPGQHRNPNSAVVVIDPGHQGSGDSTKEPNGPGSTVMKARVTSGTTGVSTGVAEYILTLDISLKLKTELENRGYTVYMTRSTHNINISNMERAQYASSVGADIAVRIHANGSTNSSVRGAETLSPSTSNPYVSHLAAASQSLGRSIVNAYCSATGFNNRGVIASDTMTGINWSEVPVTILEMGFMSNAAEDQAMQDATMQNNMVQGIANGIDNYFGF